MKRVLALAVLSLCSVPAQAEELVAHAGLARYALAADQGAFLDWLDPQSRAVFAAAMGGDHGALGLWWSQAMAGAVQMRREDGDLAETLWFNPLFDAGLAARWQRQGDRWVAQAAVPITGATLRGDRATAETDMAGLPALAARTWAAAADDDWLGHDATNSGTAVLTRIGTLRTALDLLRAAPGYEDAGVMARTALVTGSDAGLPADIRTALARVGTNARLSLRPVAGFRRADGWTMALQSPDAPMLTWLVDFADAADGGAATITGYRVLNLGDVQ